MYILLAIVGLAASASAKDLIVGHEGGRLIFEQNVTASPAIWRQEKNLTVNASDYEVITRVAVTDRREEKNGEAAVVEGGEGHKNVTIQLKSPAVFRGYDFLVQVYAKSEDGIERPANTDQEQPKDVNQGEKALVTPVSTSSTAEQSKSLDKVQQPIAVAKVDEQTRPSRDTKGQQTQKPLSPPVTNDTLENKSVNTKDDWSTLIDSVGNDSLTTNDTSAYNDTAQFENDPEDFKFDVAGNDFGQIVKVNNLHPVSSTTEKSVGQEQKNLKHEPAKDSELQQHQLKGVPLPYVKQ